MAWREIEIRGGDGYVKLERVGRYLRSLPLFQLAVGDECKSGGDGAERVVAGAAEERPDAFDAIDLLEAVQVPFVAALAEGPLRVRLQAAAHRVEGVAGVRGAERRALRAVVNLETIPLRPSSRIHGRIARSVSFTMK